jgi:hypothetical protein
MRLVLITGSGKCGTSVISHSFFSAGFPMGVREDLLTFRGVRTNIRGFWENRHVLQINRAILEANGLEWGKIPGRLPLHLPSDLENQMRAFLRGFPEEFCCKDPRFVWTGDLWARLVSDTVLVAAFRNPAGFIRSIANAWPETYSVAASLDACGSPELELWEESNLRLLQLSKIFPCFWIGFDDPVELLKENLRRAIEALGRTFDPIQFDDFFLLSERRFSTPGDVNRLAGTRFDRLYHTLRKLDSPLLHPPLLH